MHFYKKRAVSVRNVLIAFCLAIIAVSCDNGSRPNAASATVAKKVGVLLVNHGSRSETWRNALIGLEKSVAGPILKGGKVKGIKTAFMEYTEPSIATRLKEFDTEGYSDVIIIPIFLTVSTHSFDDIPTITGLKEDPQSMQTLKMENIERFTPRAHVTITPLLDFTDVLRKNVLRRVTALSKNGSNEGLVLIAYGDKTYNAEWSALMDTVGRYVSGNTQISAYSYGWCGHIAGYNPDSTTVAVKRVLTQRNTAVVIPVLVARDEMFQVKIIGDGIAKIPNAKEKVLYTADAILPDSNIEHWVIHIADEYAGKIVDGIAQK